MQSIIATSLRHLVARIGIQRATWFYPSTSSHKFYPVDPLLAQHLEEAYFVIEPYKESYSDELRSAVALGAEAEGKLKHIMAEVGVDVIFQDKSSARIYARHLPARLSKSFLTSLLRDKGTAGGSKQDETSSRGVADMLHVQRWYIAALTHCVRTCQRRSRRRRRPSRR